MVNPFKKINLLTEWYEEALQLSSSLAYEPKYDRKKVEFIFQTLITFFGPRFFEVKVGEDRTIEKISWIVALLSNNRSIPCYHALYDVCLLTRYVHTLDESIQNEFKDLKKNPDNLRSYFFELFIYRLLDVNQIPNEKKIVSGNQQLEGTCVLNQKTFLFECRKAFLPGIHELDTMRRLTIDLQMLGQNMKHGIGMICCIKMNRPVSSRHHHEMLTKLQLFFKRLNEFTSTPKIQYRHEDEYGTFTAVDYDEATLIETKSKKEYDLLYYVIPPLAPIPGIQNHYRVKIISHFEVYRSKIYSKLESVLKEKKKQHEDSAFQNKIMFLDSESLPEFRMNLFQNQDMYDAELVREVYKKTGLKHILCVVIRSYNEQGMQLYIDVIAANHLQVTATKLQSMIRNYAVFINASIKN
ncbi:hypothetical protein QEG73_25520 [Chitinophagaceae bacterium 26-R-25]|nr:hypothetical protein [Chitinophagaceae bacterium 26-R-25]